MWLLNNDISVKNVIYWKQSYNCLLSPSTYYHPLSIYRCIRFFHYSKQYCRLIIFQQLYRFFVHTLSTDWTFVSFKALITFGNKQKLHGSGEYEGCSGTISIRISIAFTLNFLIRAFFIFGNMRVFQYIDCCFAVRSYWKNLCFVICDDIYEKLWFLCEPFHHVRGNVLQVILLFPSEIFPYQFLAYLIHLAEPVWLSLG